jgi:hypothetical protein
MKKKKVTAKKAPVIVPVGVVLTELVIWEFSQDEAVICHLSEQLCRAMLLSYNLQNFGVASFGISEE